MREKASSFLPLIQPRTVIARNDWKQKFEIGRAYNGTYLERHTKLRIVRLFWSFSVLISFSVVHSRSHSLPY